MVERMRDSNIPSRRHSRSCGRIDYGLTGHLYGDRSKKGVLDPGKGVRGRTVNRKLKWIIAVTLTVVIITSCFVSLSSSKPPITSPARTALSTSIQTIDSIGYVGEDTSIAIDSNDKIHISYYDGSNTNLKYATNSSGTWVKFTIDNTGDVGEDTSIAVDSNDGIHISYFDDTNGDLKYATDASGSWISSTIDSVGSVGWYASIAVDSSDGIHISYCDSTNYDLKYATNSSGSWVNSAIDSTGSVGWYSSIAVDSNDGIHIS